MHQGQTLFALQNELMDKKMETTMNTRLVTFRDEMREEFRADLARVVAPLERAMAAFREDLNNFKAEMREFKQEVREEMREIRHELHGLGTRLTAVEAVLGMRQQQQGEIRTRFLDYSFKAGWVVIFVFISVSSTLIINYLQH